MDRQKKSKKYDDGDGPAKPIVPRVTWDPDLAPDIVKVIRGAQPYQLRDPRSLTHREGPLDRFESRGFNLPAPGVIVAAAASMSLTRMVPDKDFPLALTLVCLGWGAALAAVIGYKVAKGKAERRQVQRMKEARKQYVLDEDLSEEAGQLLARANLAVVSILRSSVHMADLLDRQRNEMMLPAQRWEIAETLRDYSRLVKAEPTKAEGEKLTALLDSRRRALTTSLDGIGRQVTALETYAAQVAEADRQYRELQQIQKLTAGSNEVLDLLARTARNDLAVAEIEGMTGEAAVVAATFTAALESAKEAAVIALPTRTTAA
ncbi:hypothetical protein ABZX93_33560 [Streptomyces sp. NPDC006632]|uniref:hypothetical protein n=1 Tax=Streptomyces sp. NPDC006632 TaxID=3157182 RepID=UPI0033BCFFE1